MILWTEPDGIKSSLFTPEGWGTVEPLGAGIQGALRIDTAGDMLAVRSSVGRRWIHFRGAAGWGPPIASDRPNDVGAGIGILRAGEALVGLAHGFDRIEVVAHRLTADADEEPAVIGSHYGGSTTRWVWFEEIAASAAGVAAVWGRYPISEEREGGLWANHREPDGTWGEPDLVSPVDDGVDEPAVASNPAGQIMAVWTDARDRDHPQIAARAFLPGRGWQQPSVVAGTATLGAIPAVAVAADGSGAAAWLMVESLSGRTRVWVSAYR